MSESNRETKTIVFIHGNFVTRHCWDHWVQRFEAAGYDCVAIAYPGRDQPVAVHKRRLDDPILAGLTLPDVIEHHVRAIKALPEKPIIIGHSFGGLLTQLMLQRGLGVVGVAIDSVPPQGVLTLKWSFFRSTWPVLNPFVPASSPYYMPFKHFQYTFANDLSPMDQRAAYDADVVPESRTLARGGLTKAARVDFVKVRPPLLMIAGDNDHIMPAALNLRNYKRYANGPSVTDFKEFPRRAHYSVIGGPGWEEVADFAINWATNVQRATPSRGTDPAPEYAHANGL